jgi:hypothetical protein
LFAVCCCETNVAHLCLLNGMMVVSYCELHA